MHIFYGILKEHRIIHNRIGHYLYTCLVLVLVDIIHSQIL